MGNPPRAVQGLLVAALLASSGGAGAEEVRVGLKGGLAIPSITGGTNELSRGYSSRLAPNFGLLAELAVTERFSVQAELNFAGQGGKRDGLQPLTIPADFGPLVPPGTTLYADFESEAILNYLELPLLAKVGWGQRWRVYADLGGFVGLLLSARNVTRGTSLVYTDKQGSALPVPPQDFEASTTVTSELKRFNLGLAGGGGVAFRSGRHEVMFDLRGTYGLTTIQKTSENGQNHTGSAVIALGYSLRL